jgi:hypothetical protein
MTMKEVVYLILPLQIHIKKYYNSAQEVINEYN